MTLKTIIAAAALLLATAAQGQGFHYDTVKGDPMQARLYTLGNGLRVYLSVNKEKPRLQTYIAVRTGSRNDPAETTGLAHYLEHLMFKGTTHFGSSNTAAEAPLLDSIQNRFEAYRLLKEPAARKQAYHEIDSISQLAAQYNIPNEYDKLMAAIGSEGSNAYTSNDVTCYVEDIPANEIENWARIQSDRFKNMVVRGFHTELEAVYEEFNIGLSNDGQKAWVALSKKLFPTHPYGTQTTIGTQEHLKNPSILNIKNYFNRYYVPNNVAICMAGDFDPDRVMAIIDKYFGDWKQSSTLSRPEYAPMATPVAPMDTTVVGLEAENLLIGWRTEGAASAQADTLRVIADMLANGKAGLFDVDLNLPMRVQGAGAYYEGMHDYGLFLLQAVPKDGQSLEVVKDLLLQEIAKLKQGRFADDLLPAVVSNLKLDYYKSLQSNKSRASKFVDAFINEQPWADQVHALDRIAKMTKRQIVDFANRFLTDGYVAVYKRQGNDTTIHKIEKPAITPIPTNNDKQSEFLREVLDSKAAPIQPRFVDFKTDLDVSHPTPQSHMLYKQNTEDGLFRLEFDYPVGNEKSQVLGMAQTLIDYAGTDRQSANDIKRAFYKLACDFNVHVSANHTRLALSGLDENMPQALALMAGLIEHARMGSRDYQTVVELIRKSREDSKANQRANFNALRNYGTYGAFNPTRNRMSAQAMKKTTGNQLLQALKTLYSLPQKTVMYYGPSSQADVLALVQKHAPSRKPAGTLETGRQEYQAQPTPKNEIWLAPYDAKNIYMMQYHNEDRAWTPANAPVNALFNEYFGGGMNAIVFQELREARGLAYSAAARYNEPWRRKDKEDFYTYIITQNDKMMDCIHEFNHLLDSIPARQAGFDLAKQSLLKSLATARTTRFDVLDAYMTAQDRGLDYDINQTIYDRLPALQLDDLMKFAAGRIAGKPFRYLILGDEQNLDIKSLEKIAPIRRLTTREIFGY